MDLLSACARTSDASSTAPSPPLANASQTANGAPPLRAGAADDGDLVPGVRREPVQRDDRHLAEVADALEVLREVREPSLDGPGVGDLERGLRHAAVSLQGANRRNEDDGGRVEARGGALDVEELLGAEVESEPRLRHDPVGEGKGGLRGEDRAATVGDVRERPAVDEGGDPLAGLDEVRVEGVAEEGEHGSRRLQVPRGDRAFPEGQADDDPLEPSPEILRVLGETEGGHDLGGGRDVEAGLPRDALEDPAEPDDDVPEGSVVHVEDTPPEDPPRVDLEPVAVVDVVVEEGREEVVGRGHRVKVAREVEVHVVGRDEARAAAAGRPSLHPERRAEGGLAEGDTGLLAEAGQPLREADGRRRLSLAGVGRRDRRDEDEASPLRLGSRRCREDLCLVAAVGDEPLRGEAEPGGDVREGPDRRIAHDSLHRGRAAGRPRGPSGKYGPAFPSRHGGVTRSPAAS